MKITIIEDDVSLARGMQYTLEKEGFQVRCLTDCASGARALDQELPDLVLLDWNLPDGDGLELCRRMRKESQVPILMITARDMEIDQVMCLECGADDYIAKPFSLAVLKARIQALLRRSGRMEAETCRLVSGEIRLLEKEMKVFRGDTPLELSLTEFKLLKYFLEHKNQVLLKEQILERVWDRGEFVEENTLTVNIRRLRRKVEVDPASPRYIRTIHGMGYLWEERDR